MTSLLAGTGIIQLQVSKMASNFTPENYAKILDREDIVSLIRKSVRQGFLTPEQNDKGETQYVLSLWAFDFTRPTTGEMTYFQLGIAKKPYELPSSAILRERWLKRQSEGSEEMESSCVFPTVYDHHHQIAIP